MVLFPANKTIKNVFNVQLKWKAGQILYNGTKNFASGSLQAINLILQM